jgi:LuxR family maltose regulon positive regulatory protein
LFGRLAGAGRVAVVSAPAGSGKTVLLRSWIGAAGLGGRAAWVPVEAGERDGQRFWLSVVGALRRTAPGAELVRALTAAPELDGWAVVERLLKDLARLDERVWLVVDDVHELGSDQARRQLELLLMRGPEELRFVLATRAGVRLGLRLVGELTEIRGEDLRFSLAEAGELFAAARVELPDPALGIDLPRAFRTADLWLIHAADCCSMYSSWTCCGVRYRSPECRRLELYQNSMYLTTSRRACSRVGYWVR